MFGESSHLHSPQPSDNNTYVKELVKDNVTANSDHTNNISNQLAIAQVDGNISINSENSNTDSIDKHVTNTRDETKWPLCTDSLVSFWVFNIFNVP